MILLLMVLLFLDRGEGQTILAPGQQQSMLRTTGTAIVVPCTLHRPCLVRFNGVVYTLTQEARVTNIVGSGTATVTVQNTGLITVWHDVTSMVCTNTNCIKAPPPTDGLWLGQCLITSGVVSQCINQVPMAGRDTFAVGWGLQVAGNTVSVLPWLFPTIGQVPALATSPCTTGTMAWDSQWLYVCTATDTWRRTALTAW